MGILFIYCLYLFLSIKINFETLVFPHFGTKDTATQFHTVEVRKIFLILWKPDKIFHSRKDPVIPQRPRHIQELHFSGGTNKYML